jgi:hypothetical protein
VALFARVRLSAAGDVLTYRGALRIRAWRRDQIERFGIVQSGWRPTVGHVEMRTLDGHCVTFLVASASRRREARLQEWLVAIEDWRQGASAIRYR